MSSSYNAVFLSSAKPANQLFFIAHVVAAALTLLKIRGTCYW